MNNKGLPVNNAILSSLYKDYRDTGISLDNDHIKNKSVIKIDTGLTNQDAVSELLHETISSNTYITKFASSFDTIFVPYTTSFTESGSPHFTPPTKLTQPNSLTLNPFNPNNELSIYYAPTGSQLYNLSIDTSGAPTSSETGLMSNPSGWLENGHNISWSTMGTGQYESYGFDNEFIRNTGTIVEVENIRSIGLKAPMILTGWGFNTKGKPVPADPDNEDAFASGAFRNPLLWMSGPVDLRWDNTRGVWTGGNTTNIFLCKSVNQINTKCFSYEVERDPNASQYTRHTMGTRAFDGSSSETIYDPQYVAYTGDTGNIGCRVSLDYSGLDAPMYEAYVIRETVDPAGPAYYNLATDDCSDCGSIVNQCSSYTQHGSSAVGKKVIIENPMLRQVDPGDLLFTVDTGRTKNINTGSFIDGSGVGASGYIQTDSNGNGSGVVTTIGSGYSYGAFGLQTSGNFCTDIVLSTGVNASISGITINPSTNLPPDSFVQLQIIPTNAVVETETLPIMWILDQQKKTTTVVTHVKCQGGLLTKMTRKIMVDWESCEHGAEQSMAINSF
jgi:hypothetical protein